MPSVRLSTATKSPKRLVTPRNSMNGFAAGSVHGANFRRMGPTAVSAIASIRSLLRFQVCPEASDHPLQLGIVRRGDEESIERGGGRIDTGILNHVFADLRLRILVAVGIVGVIGVARCD